MKTTTKYLMRVFGFALISAAIILEYLSLIQVISLKIPMIAPEVIP